MKLSFHVRRLNLKHVWRISRDQATYKENVFVFIEHEGIIGMGEAAPNIRYQETTASVLDFLKRAESHLEQADPWQFYTLSADMRKLDSGQSAARAAIDMALMDWIGKRLELPLYRYWGLPPSPAPLTSYSIGIDEPDKIKEKVQEAQAYPILKIKLGSSDDEAIMRMVRETTDRPVRVDANEAWHSPEAALEKIHWLAGLNVEFVEQPLPAGRLQDVAWLRRRSPLPLVADEDVKTAADIPALASVYDGINIKLMKSGGLQEALRMIHVARACGLKVMLGCMIESSLAITAASHLSPLADWLDLDGNLLLTNDPYSGSTVAGGKMVLPQGPGIGAVPHSGVF